MNSFTVIFSVFVVLLFTNSMIRHIRNTNKLLREGNKATGTIVGQKFRLGRTSTFHPLIQFTTTTGEIIEVEGHSGIAIPMYSKGEKATIYYEASNPKNFALDSEFEQSTPYITLIILWMVVATAVVYYVSG